MADIIPLHPPGKAVEVGDDIEGYVLVCGGCGGRHFWLTGAGLVTCIDCGCYQHNVLWDFIE